MGIFKQPKVPTPTPPPTPAITPVEANPEDPSLGLATQTGSLISTSARGLRRRASTQRTSLIGG